MHYLRLHSNLWANNRVADDRFAESEIESRTLVGSGLRPNRSPMLVDDTGYRSQSDAGPFEILHAVQALEDPEELVREFHVEADSVVADVDGSSLRHHAAADLDDRVLAGASELCRIAEQVGEDLLYQPRIALDRREPLNTPFNLEYADLVQFFNDALGCRKERDRLPV